jgi:hypothetical protein
VHIEICAGGCNAGNEPKDKQDVGLFFAEALISHDQGREVCAPFPPLLFSANSNFNLAFFAPCRKPELLISRSGWWA